MTGRTKSDMLAPVRALKILNRRDEAIRADVTRDVGKALGDAASVETTLVEATLKATAITFARMDQEHEEACRRAPALVPACFAGCSYCCHVHAYATGPEVFAVAAFLKKNLDAETLQSMTNKLVSRAKEVEALSDEERWNAKIPCALLDPEGRCSVYAARPLRCRAFHSLSADVCREAFFGAPDIDPVTAPLLDRVVDAVEEGYDLGLKNAQIQAEGYRLEIALAIMLTIPDAAERWLALEPVFTDVSFSQT